MRFHESEDRALGEPRLDALSAREVYEVFQLVNEILERGEDPRGWRAHMVRWLRGRLGAQLVIDAEALPDARGLNDLLAATACRGDADDDLVHALDLSHPDAALLEPLWLSVAGRVGATERQHVASTGQGECLVSHRALPSCGIVHGIVVARAAGAPRFEEGARQLLALLHDQLARHAGGAATGGRPLTPALRATLAALLSGDSEKEAAERLRIGIDALHDRIRRLYRQVGARSRGELLAKATVELYIPRPRFHVEHAGSDARRGPRTHAAYRCEAAWVVASASTSTAASTT